MTAEELARLQMQLQYEKAQRLWEKGKISKAELDALRPEVVVAKLSPPTPIGGVSFPKLNTESRGVAAYKTQQSAILLNPEAMEAVGLLKAEMHEIDKKKGALSNSLGSYPKHVSVPQITEQILSLRDEWANRSKMVKVIEISGAVPAPPAGMPYHPDGGVIELLSNEAMQQAIIDSLPTDKYELKSKERNLVALLSKDRGKLRAAKDPGKKQELSVKIQQNELVLQAMRDRLK